MADDAATAVAVAAAQIRAGQARTCIVAGWGRASEGDADRISNALFDPFFAQPLGLTELDAVRASARRRRCARSRITARARGAAGGGGRVQEGARTTLAPRAARCARRRSRRSPTSLRRPCSRRSRATSRWPGSGMSSDPYWPGDRDLLELPGAARRRATGAGAAGARSATSGVFELDGPTLFDEALALRGGRRARRRARGMRALAADPRCLPSGGYAGGACAPAMGLVRDARRGRRAAGTGRPGGARSPRAARPSPVRPRPRWCSSDADARVPSRSAASGRRPTAAATRTSRRADLRVGCDRRRAAEDAQVGWQMSTRSCSALRPTRCRATTARRRAASSARSARPVMRVNTGGLTGASARSTLAVDARRRGQTDTVVAVALERMGQATSSQAVFNTIFDPIWEKDIALSTLSMGAIRASMLMRALRLHARPLGGDRRAQLRHRDRPIRTRRSASGSRPPR